MYKKSLGLLLALIVSFCALSGCEGQSGDYREYEFCTINDLYAGGVISMQEFLNIAYYVNDGITEKNADKYPEDFVPAPKTPAEIDESELEDVIEEFLTDRTNRIVESDYVLYDNYGSYGDYVLIELLDRKHDNAFAVSYTVFGIEIKLKSYYHCLVAYKKAGKNNKPTSGKNTKYEFYNIKDLYENGELSMQDILTVAYFNNSGILSMNDDVYPEDFVFTPKNPIRLDVATEKAVADAYSILKYKETGAFYIEDCLGTYGDYVIVYIVNAYGGTDAMSYPQVGGVTFEFPGSAHMLLAYKVVNADLDSAQ
ncbi:MAG: hypothetical protein J6126_00685 [Clostridia bacterium]|nr:hypothetical protein [Clostridia bacterium]